MDPQLNERKGQKLGGASVADVSDKTNEDASPPDPHSFNFLNWLYWNLWWQQYSYWTAVHQQSFAYQHWNGGSAPDVGARPVPVPGGPGTNPNYRGVGGSGPQWNMGTGRPQPQQPARGVTNRIVSGYESCIAPLWRRALAETIDMILFALLLKLYLPDLDFRIPELIFEGPELWNRMATDELVLAKDTLLLFVYSTLLQRGAHVILEAVWLSVFGCTPGKWLMGLRVWRCSSPPHYTRTTRGSSIRVEPGGNMSFLLALSRSFFKSAVSLVVPIVIFFFQLDKGRTQYDRLFRCVVVDTYSLNKPLYTTVYTRNQVNG